MPLPEGAYYLYQSFLVQLEHWASAAAPFGGVRGNAPAPVGGFLLRFDDDLGSQLLQIRLQGRALNIQTLLL